MGRFVCEPCRVSQHVRCWVTVQVINARRDSGQVVQCKCGCGALPQNPEAQEQQDYRILARLLQRDMSDLRGALDEMHDRVHRRVTCSAASCDVMALLERTAVS